MEPQDPFILLLLSKYNVMAIVLVYSDERWVYCKILQANILRHWESSELNFACLEYLCRNLIILNYFLHLHGVHF